MSIIQQPTLFDIDYLEKVCVKFLEVVFSTSFQRLIYRSIYFEYSLFVALFRKTLDATSDLVAVFGAGFRIALDLPTKWLAFSVRAPSYTKASS